jgi:hypothetical protein
LVVGFAASAEAKTSKDLLESALKKSLRDKDSIQRDYRAHEAISRPSIRDERKRSGRNIKVELGDGIAFDLPAHRDRGVAKQN